MADKAYASTSGGKVNVPLDSYNRALRKGRHPRSFGRDDTSTLWNALKTSSDRVSNVRFGQTLGSVVDKEAVPPPSSPVMLSRVDSIAAPSRDGRDEGSPVGRQSFSRLRGKAPALALGMAGSSSPEKRDALRRGKKKHHHNGSTDDVLCRLQALGTTSSPTLSVPVAATNAPGQPPPASTSSSSTSNDIDTAKLRNDFSAQSDARIYFGSTVALELFNGDMMMVSVADSSVVVHPLEHIKHQAKGARDKLLFTLVNLHELRSANAIKYGDSVWLQLSVGTGETSWEQGGVLGAKVRKAPELNALTLSQKRSSNPLDPSDNKDNCGQDPDVLINVGFPVPVKAYLPKTRDDTTDSQIDDMQARLRNKSSRMLGRWIMRSAVANANAKDGYVYNNHEIYLEQDWFYLGADSDPLTRGHVAVLRQLPPPKNHKPGEYIIERRTAWKVRLVDSSNGGLGLSLVQQQMERLLFKAKTQLKASERMRDGESRCYGNGLQGGQNFPRQMRQHIQTITTTSDQAYIGLQHDRVSNLNAYFETKMAAMDDTTAGQRRGKKHQLSPLDSGGGGSVLQGARSMTSLTSSSSSSSSVQVCNLCVSNRRFDLCTHDHDVSRLLSTGAPLVSSPSAGSSMHSRSASDRSLLSTADQLTRAKQSEAADMRERDRIMRMLGDQDARLVGVIRTTEHQAAMAAIQRRTHHDFSEDDVPHFTSTVSMRHKRHAPPPPEDGLPDIDELRRHLSESKPKGLFADDEEDDNGGVSGADNSCDDDVDGDEGQDQDNGGDDGRDSDASSDTDDDFITDAEIQTLEFVNVDKASMLYGNDEKALLEMLVGFADLALHRVVPQLREALSSHNKASLLETADFLARAAEFVVARRIQVHVMGLIQSVATSNVDDFSGIEPTLDRLIKEVEGTARFVEKFKAKQQQPPLAAASCSSNDVIEEVNDPHSSE
ncbi:hypothetical protein, variant 2 [Aphanomyces astaci]|uniref:Uncharacterized protein n=1 Tax=Aphanomyces astaci TaxID=112090 RepID=W4H602_APHAT|nr:hypothetical protein, variant 2 [Aphanomyces astaci]ETV87455.1 hypothetical protein, variant 2 [Aphanomyces astaci]|eukprot:XP_009822319.1 hypothetical protein, variant 2 [Aphanomyces astaci]